MLVVEQGGRVERVVGIRVAVNPSEGFVQAFYFQWGLACFLMLLVVCVRRLGVESLDFDRYRMCLMIVDPFPSVLVVPLNFDYLRC